MSLALPLMAARQNPASRTVVQWSAGDPNARGYIVIVAKRRLEPDEVEAAVTSGHAEAHVVKLPASAAAMLDDVTAGGEARYYGVVIQGSDGTLKPGRFRAAAAAAAPEGCVNYSSFGGPPAAAAAPPPPAAAGPRRGPFASSADAPAASVPPPAPPPPSEPAPVRRGPFATSADAPAAPPPAAEPVRRGPFAPSADAAPPPAAEPAPVRRGAFAPSAEAAPAPAAEPAPVRRGAFAPSTEAPPPAAPPPAPPPVESSGPRRGAFAASSEESNPLQAAAAASGAFARPSPHSIATPSADESGGATGVFRAAALPASEFPVESLKLQWTGQSQTWDGVRVTWSAGGNDPAAYEVYVSDHPMSADEVGELIRGEKIPGSAVRAVNATATGVLDNLTPREGRGYYAVVARAQDGSREQVTCEAKGTDDGGPKDAPFLDPMDLDEVRALATGVIQEARMQLMIFKEDNDVGAWREALRMCDEARIIYPGFRPASELEKQVRDARQA